MVVRQLSRSERLPRWAVLGVWSLVLLTSFALLGCSGGGPAEQRAAAVGAAQGDILIGAAGDWSSPSFALAWDGLELAAEEVNGAGGVLGRKIRLLKEDDQGLVLKAETVAHKLAANQELGVVIGHSQQYITKPLSLYYESQGILAFSPLCDTPALDRSRHSLFFCNMPSEEDFGSAMARYCDRHNYHRVVLYHTVESYGDSLANAFTRAADDANVSVVDRRWYVAADAQRAVRRDWRLWKDNFTFDAILCLGDMDKIDVVICCLRDQAKADLPIISNGALRLDLLGSRLQSGNECIASPFDPGRPEAKDFVAKFKKRYGMVPDAAAAQYYDALKVLATAMNLAKSASPDRVAAALRGIKNWPGVTGQHTFMADGSVTNKPVYLLLLPGQE